MTKEEVKEIEMRCQGATPGPWNAHGIGVIMTQGNVFYLEGANTYDQKFIAHSRKDMARLIEEIQNLTAGLQDQWLTKEEIIEIKVRCENATAGPWKSYIEARDEISGSDFIMTEEEDIYIRGATINDHDFIAHARQDILNLVAEVERLRPAEFDAGKG